MSPCIEIAGLSQTLVLLVYNYLVPAELSWGDVGHNGALVDPAADFVVVDALPVVGGGGGVGAPHPSRHILRAIGVFEFTFEVGHSS